MTLEDCKIYTIHGIEMIHIAEFAQLTGRSIQSTRHLIEDGNKIRKMKFFRDRSRLMIPVKELWGFPLIDAGYCSGPRNVYHYVKNEDGTISKELCQECSFGDHVCKARQEAESLIVPEGDK